MSDNGSASTSIDIEDLCKQLVKEVTDSIQTTLQRPEICIYHVPVKFRRLNDVAYTPQIISIGPIHHNKNELQGMETQKRKYFKQFFDRLPEDKGEEREEFRGKLVSTIKDCEVKIRNCYQDEASKLCEDPKGFLKMILRDAAFILELFLKTREFTRDEKKSQDKYKYDYIIGKPWLAAAIHRDLILLENQLPFWILEKLYKLATEYIETDCLSFLELSCQYFETYNKSKNNPQKTLHFTDLVRYFLSSEHPKQIGAPINNLYRATRLQQAGIKFKPMENKCLLDIRSWSADSKMEQVPPVPGKTDSEREGTDEPQVSPVAGSADLEREGTDQPHEPPVSGSTYLEREGEPHGPLLSRRAETRRKGDPSNEVRIKKGELHVPPLVIEDNTECLLRNLMVLEQCHYPYEAYICQYVKFLDFLVETGEDADLLIKSKVIINRLGESKAVSKLINNLCLEIVEDSSCYEGLATELNKYYKSTFNYSIAYLRRVYFKNVWIGTGTVVGLILLFISLVQFVRSFV